MYNLTYAVANGSGINLYQFQVFCQCTDFVSTASQNNVHHIFWAGFILTLIFFKI